MRKHLAWDLDSNIVEADSSVGGVDQSLGSGNNSVVSGLGNMGSGNWDGVGVDSWDDSLGNNWGSNLVSGVGNWGGNMVGSVGNWGSNMVDTSGVGNWVDESTGVDKSGISLSLSLGNGVGNWDIVDRDHWGVSQSRVSVDSWDSKVVVGNWVVDTSGVGSWDN